MMFSGGLSSGGSPRGVSREDDSTRRGLEEKMRGLMDELKDMHRKKEEADRNARNVRSDLDSSIQRYKRDIQQGGEIQKAGASLDLQIHQALRTMDQLYQDFDAASKENADLQSQLAGLKLQLRQEAVLCVHRQGKQLEGEVANTTNMVKRLEEDNALARGELKALLMELNESQRKKRSLPQELEASSSFLSGRFTSLGSTIADTRHKIKDRRQEVDATRGRIAQLKDTLRRHAKDHRREMHQQAARSKCQQRLEVSVAREGEQNANLRAALEACRADLDRIMADVNKGLAAPAATSSPQHQQQHGGDRAKRMGPITARLMPASWQPPQIPRPPYHGVRLLPRPPPPLGLSQTSVVMPHTPAPAPAAAAAAMSYSQSMPFLPPPPVPLHTAMHQ
ncbi:unnamed protein product [Vitrella brassicaformis CCMP3155]|uniref:Uncharacterized protein n=2 Tax=Vitrella brassicaformis TaxID=1169539 RepID=A0A0G4EMU7_VITBC|nr:unnamed protein product [Vitrella brassicaformis CCMP3155]|eukprot:CEL98139.1 unnamed protein product [Vitrella brassicaformis CCMP3155]